MAGPQGGGNRGSTKYGPLNLRRSGFFRGPISPAFLCTASYFIPLSAFLTEAWLRYERPSISAIDAFLNPVKGWGLVWFCSAVCVFLLALILILKPVHPPHASELKHFAWSISSMVIIVAFVFSIMLTGLTLPGSISCVAIALTAVVYVRLDSNSLEFTMRRRLNIALVAFIVLVLLWFVYGFLGLLYFESYIPWEIGGSLLLLMFGLMGLIIMLAASVGWRFLKQSPDRLGLS